MEINLNIKSIYKHWTCSQHLVQAQLLSFRFPSTLGYIHSPVHPSGFPLVSLKTSMANSMENKNIVLVPSQTSASQYTIFWPDKRLSDFLMFQWIPVLFAIRTMEYHYFARCLFYFALYGKFAVKESEGSSECFGFSFLNNKSTRIHLNWVGLIVVVTCIWLVYIFLGGLIMLLKTT